MTKDQIYVTERNKWLREHPEATKEQIEEFCRELAKKLNY